MRPFTAALVLLLLASPLSGTEARPGSVDADGDGITDAREQDLLTRFTPRFLISSRDCALAPAEFTPNQSQPVPSARNGTLYGQVSPWSAKETPEDLIEIRYFHLWAQDCGRIGHPLDAEHVSVLVRLPSTGPAQAVSWYAAAHEETVCEHSQTASAASLAAEFTGPRVWVSAGKHASFLTEEACRRGCGGDRCERPVPLTVPRVINLGEPGHPLNGALWSASPRWTLAAKMGRSDFPSLETAGLQERGQPATQAAISVGNTTVDALALGRDKTGNAVSKSEAETGSALALSYRKVKKALAASKRAVEQELKK